jgi:hypothetical protein
MSAEKQGLERGAITAFSEALADLIPPINLLFHELREPPEPDGFCSLLGEFLHIEVGHIYGTESDAKRLLGRTGQSAPTEKQVLHASLTPLDQRLLVPLNNLLADKATKNYKSDRVWLLVRSGFPLWSVRDFEEHRQNIVIPSAYPFEQIWLLCGPDASFGVLRLA